MCTSLVTCQQSHNGKLCAGTTVEAVATPDGQSFPSHYLFLHIIRLIESSRLAGDTAQGNALGVLARVAKKVAGLTGTLLSGYADDLFNTLFRVDANRMVRDGFTWGAAGKERFTQQFGVIETIERTKIEDNACSKKNKTEVTIRRRPGVHCSLVNT